MSDELIKAQSLLEETRKLGDTNDLLSKVSQKLSKKIKADIHFLERCETERDSRGLFVSTHNSLSSSNIPYLSGILRVVNESEGVTEVIYDLRRYGIVVDVMCDRGRTWKKVIARNPQSLHLIWAGQGQYGSKDIVKKAEKYVTCARQHNEFLPPRVVYVFCNGVTHEMAEALESKGIQVEGKRVDVSEEVAERLTAVYSDSDDSESEDENFEGNSNSTLSATRDEASGTGDSLIKELQELDGDEKIFLDITTMLVYVSDLCNGGSDGQFSEPVLTKQAAEERQRSALDTILPHMAGRRLVTCQSALDDYWGIVKIMAGVREKERARALTDRLVVVPDCMSPRFSSLTVSGQIRKRSKVIFGAADMLRCNILTSNEGFIRAAAAQNIHISAVIHQPRALSEEKKLP